MALPEILFNSSTGSDTQASGAGPSTAVYGTGASLNSSTSVDLSADSPDLSGVATDGSACLWVASSSGRQFSRITNVNNTTKIVTVATTYSVTESGRTWAIGGKRATWDNTNSRTVFSATGAESGWIITTETDQTITSSSISTGLVSGTTVRGNSTSTRRVINQTANAAIFAGTAASGTNTFMNLKFTCSNGTKTNATALTNSSARVFLCINCEFGDSTNQLLRATSTSASHFVLIYCNVHDCTISSSGYVFELSNVGSSYRIYDSWIHDNANARGIREDSSGGPLHIVNTVYENNGGSLIRGTQNKTVYIVGNTINGNGESGIDYDYATFSGQCVIRDNQFTNNTGYGVKLPSATNFNEQIGNVIDYNNFYNNSSGTYSGTYAGGANDTTNNPGYKDSANSDFTLTRAVRALGCPGAYLADLPVRAYNDQGAVQSLAETNTFIRRGSTVMKM